MGDQRSRVISGGSEGVGVEEEREEKSESGLGWTEERGRVGAGVSGGKCEIELGRF